MHDLRRAPARPWALACRRTACADCAGLGDFTCERCGREGRRYLRGICGNCVLTDRLALLLDDGTGAPRRELRPLLEAVGQMQRPWVGITWIGTEHIQHKLRALARGQVPLTHEGLHQLGTPRSTAFLRDLLMEHGIHPRRDRDLIMFECWLTQRLDGIAEPHRSLLEQYATWDILRKLRATAAQQPLGPSRADNARTKITQAEAFLSWLDHRGRPDEATQTDLDAWHSEKRTTRRSAQQFLRWAMKTGNMPRLHVPDIPTGNPAPLSQRRRLDLIRRFLTDDGSRSSPAPPRPSSCSTPSPSPESSDSPSTTSLPPRTEPGSAPGDPPPRSRSPSRAC